MLTMRVVDGMRPGAVCEQIVQGEMGWIRRSYLVPCSRLNGIGNALAIQEPTPYHRRKIVHIVLHFILYVLYSAARCARHGAVMDAGESEGLVTGKQPKSYPHTTEACTSYMCCSPRLTMVRPEWVGRRVTENGALQRASTARAMARHPQSFVMQPAAHHGAPRVGHGERLPREQRPVHALLRAEGSQHEARHLALGDARRWKVAEVVP